MSAVPFPTTSSRTQHASFLRNRLSDDHLVSVAVWCVWPAARVMRILRRLLPSCSSTPDVGLIPGRIRTPGRAGTVTPHPLNFTSGADRRKSRCGGHLFIAYPIPRCETPNVIPKVRDRLLWPMWRRSRPAARYGLTVAGQGRVSRRGRTFVAGDGRSRPRRASGDRAISTGDSIMPAAVTSRAVRNPHS